MLTELKPCPFCGCISIYLGQGSKGSYPRRGAWGCDVHCRGCGAATVGIELPKDYHKMSPEKYRAAWAVMREQAAKQWNRRP